MIVCVRDHVGPDPPREYTNTAPCLPEPTTSMVATAASGGSDAIVDPNASPAPAASTPGTTGPPSPTYSSCCSTSVDSRPDVRYNTFTSPAIVSHVMRRVHEHTADDNRKHAGAQRTSAMVREFCRRWRSKEQPMSCDGGGSDSILAGAVVVGVPRTNTPARNKQRQTTNTR